MAEQPSSKIANARAVVTSLAAHEWRRCRWSPLWMIGLAGALTLAFTETETSQVLGYPTINQALYGFQLSVSVLFGLICFLLASGSFAADLDGPLRALLFSRQVPTVLYLLGKCCGLVSFCLVLVIPILLFSVGSPLLHGYGRLHSPVPFLLVMLVCVFPMLCFTCALAAFLGSVLRRVILSFPLFLVYFFAVVISRPDAGTVNWLDFSGRLYPHDLIIQVPLHLREVSFAGLLDPLSPALLLRSALYAALSALLLAGALLALRFKWQEKVRTCVGWVTSRLRRGSKPHQSTWRVASTTLTACSDELALFYYSFKMLFGRNLLAVLMISAGLIFLVVTYAVGPFQTREGVLILQYELFTPLLGIVILSDLVAAEFEARRFDALRVSARGPAWIIFRRLVHAGLFGVAACLLSLVLLRLFYTRFSIWLVLGVCLPGMLFFGMMALLAGATSRRSVVGYAVGTAAVILSLVLKQVEPLTLSSFFQRASLANGRLAGDWNWLLAKLVFLALALLLAWVVFRIVARPAIWRRPLGASLAVVLLVYTGLHWSWSEPRDGSRPGGSAVTRDLAVSESDGVRNIRRAVKMSKDTGPQAVEMASLTDVTLESKGGAWQLLREAPVDLTTEWHVRHLKMDGTVVPFRAELDITAKLEVQSLIPGQQKLLLFLATELLVEEVRIDGQLVAFTRFGDLIEAPLKEASAEGQVFSVVLHYKGRLRLPQNLRYEGVSSELMFVNSRWFPSLNNSSLGAKDRFICEYTVRVPNGYEVAASESLTSPVGRTPGSTATVRMAGHDNAFGWRSGSLVESVPLCVGRFRVYRTAYRDIPVCIYAFSVDESAARRTLDRAVQSLGVLEAAFGPLPFPRVGIVENPFQSAGGQGFASMVTLKPDRLVREHQKRLLDAYVPHELAHLWWGNSLPPWVAETCAVFANFHFLEQTANRRMALEFFSREFSSAVAELSGVPLMNGQGPGMYAKGGYLLSMLERELGPAALNSELKRFRKRHADARRVDAAALSDDFVRSLLQAAGSRRRDFVEDWIRTAKSFDPAVVSLSSSPAGNTNEIGLNLEHQGEIRFPVRVRLKFADGSISDVVWDSPKAKETIKLQSSIPAVSVEIDPENELLDWDRSNNQALAGAPARTATRQLSGWKTYTSNDGLPGLDVRCLTRGPDHRIYAGVWSMQSAMNREWAVAVFDREWRKFDPGTPPVHLISAMTLTPGGGFWFASQNQLARIDPAAGDTNWLTSEVRAGGTIGRRSFQPNPNSTLPLPGSHIYCLLPTEDGKLWMGSDHGVTTLELQDCRTHSFGIAQGFTAGEVFALVCDGAGTLWAGTDRGLFWFSGGKWSREVSVPVDLILSLAAGEGGVLWCGTYRSGLVEFRGGASRCYSRRNAPIPDTIFCCVAYGQNGVVWAGSPSGLVCYDGHSWTVYTRKNSGLPSNNVRCLVVGDAGEVWIGTDVGVTRFAPSPGNGADS